MSKENCKINKVVTLSLAYQAEPFVQQMIDSAIRQEEVENYIVVGIDVPKDGLKDGTFDLLLEAQKMYGDQLIILGTSENIGPHENYRRVWQKAYRVAEEHSIPFQAILEADDAWIDPQKLKKQINYLNQHPNCAIYFTQAERVLNDAKESFGLYVFKDYLKQIPTIFSIEDLILLGNPFPTATAIFRGQLIPDLYAAYPWIRQSKAGDRWTYLAIIHAYAQQHPNFEVRGYFNDTDITALYRHQEQGIYTQGAAVIPLPSLVAHARNFIEGYERFNQSTNGIYETAITQKVGELEYQIYHGELDMINY